MAEAKINTNGDRMLTIKDLESQGYDITTHPLALAKQEKLDSIAEQALLDETLLNEEAKTIAAQKRAELGREAAMRTIAELRERDEHSVDDVINTTAAVLRDAGKPIVVDKSGVALTEDEYRERVSS